ncbi:transposase [Saccharothrix syringae]|uniref:Transposase IS4-like domain-containing protein n=1 Tax=Saccharothrix syringae TaxID=103733 RepID=A0A5Q0GWM6_SACSY|nr:hypothetical protein EKG83_14475 [Saccharothrix syringae]
MFVPAEVPDRELARDLLWRLRLTNPQVTPVWADSAYAGALMQWARTFPNITIKVVTRPPGARGFIVLPRHWVVERSLTWLLRARRNVRDCERLPAHSEAALTWAAITLLARRLTRPTRARRTTTARRAACPRPGHDVPRTSRSVPCWPLRAPQDRRCRCGSMYPGASLRRRGRSDRGAWSRRSAPLRSLLTAATHRHARYHSPGGQRTSVIATSSSEPCRGVDGSRA